MKTNETSGTGMTLIILQSVKGEKNVRFLDPEREPLPIQPKDAMAFAKLTLALNNLFSL